MIGVFPKSSPWRFVTSAPSGLDEIVSPLDEQALRRAKHAKEIPIAQEELLLLLMCLAAFGSKIRTVIHIGSIPFDAN